jgi:hypothetical protein
MLETEASEMDEERASQQAVRSLSQCGAAIVLCYSAIADAAASANGLPSESRHTAH